MTNVSARSLNESMELPVFMAPMFLVSNPTMVIEGCKSGIVGSFPALNARTAETLENWMKQISQELVKEQEKDPEKTIAPWAINFISHRTNKRYDEDLRLIQQYQPPIVITSLGDPSPVVEIVHEYGGLVFSDVINLKFAKKALNKGVDGLILVSSGAGGHAGTLNPMAFIKEVREIWDGIIVLAGGISDGKDLLAAQALGADYVYMGTKFISALESSAVEEYKEMMIDASIEDIFYTDAFSGVKANYLTPSIRKSGLDPEKLAKKETIDFSKMNESDTKAWRDVWSAGHGVGAVKEVQPVSTIVHHLQMSYKHAQKELFNKSGETNSL